MEHYFRAEEKYRRYFVAYYFGRMEVAGVEGHDFIVLGAVCGIEVARSYGERFESDAEYFRFETVLHVVVLHGVDGVETIFEDGAIEHAVHGHFFLAVVHPKVEYTVVVELSAHFVGYGTATLCMLDPEVAYTLVGVTQCQRARERMRERGGVEVEFESVFLSPVNPSLEMSGFDFVAVYFLAVEFAVYFMKVYAVLSAKKRAYLDKVGTYFVDITGFAGIISVNLNATGEFACRFESLHIVGLPAMQ